MPGPDAPRERKLPFKRTVKRKSVDTPTNNSKSEPDSIDLFRRSGALFDKFQEQESATKAQRRKAKNVDEDAAADSEIQAQLLSDSQSASGKARIDSVDRDLKRQCISLSDDEDEPGSRPSTQRSPRKSSNAPLDRSPTKFRRPTRTATSSTPTRARSTRSSGIRADVIALDSSDDEDYKPPQGRSKAREVVRDTTVAEETHASQPRSPRAAHSDTESDPDPIEPDGTQSDPLAARFIEEARERMRRERLAREANAAATESPAPMEVVEMYIESHLEGTSNMRVKVHLLQKLGVVKNSWVGYQQKKKMPVTESVLNEMFFTWRGNKLYDFTTLASLDIKRRGDGHLYSSRETKRDGFDGWDKVHIEVWTRELFEEYQKEKETERMRQLGDIPDDEEDTEPVPEPAAKVAAIKVILKSKDHGTQNLTVPMDVEVAKLSLAFRTMKKIPEEQEIVLHFDGEVLDEESTIDEAGIEDMDCIEVHIK
ncbi:hypothetical protein PG993_000470 [Apiospora rasikravindrae]|uniref:Ubiquitin-like domain-containing protein n=1 Tax=Apiospora rasikravindrae TaxID=990691 RepID=A0ABR1U8M7_9PEZI